GGGGAPDAPVQWLRRLCRRPLQRHGQRTTLGVRRCYTSALGKGSVPLREEPAEACMSSQQPSIQGLQRGAPAALRDHWIVFVVGGVVRLVLGATAVVLPPI